ncbi:unnamed protein product [Didymodactylos carnosus]|uniref:Reverse transcriptase n=2 Tax=Didymodactylos carnosus TaxID=1234261 RepID=A0A814MFW3_9BILA|nr:unnamed protein product [Didymodactylos carnosus]CAF3845123.1 unnamed protein product [Didymodactylos carnosus]
MEHVDAILLQTILKDLTKFSGSQQQHVNDWLLTINQKFDACEPQRRKWAVAFLSDEALKKQGDTEEFTQYYADMTKLCTYYNPVMSNKERLDRLKLGMNNSLLNRCSGSIFTSPQELLAYIQRFELDQQFIKILSSSSDRKDDNIRKLSPTSTSPQQYPTFTRINSILSPTPFRQGNRRTTKILRCYHCGNSDHFIRHCPKRPRKCCGTNPSLVYINVYVNNRQTRALIDSGAAHSFITQSALSKIRHSPLLPSKTVAHLADSSTPLHIIGEVNLHIRALKTDTPITALVVKHLNSDFILGSNWFVETGARIEYDRHQVSIRSYNGRSCIPFDKHIDTLALDLKLLSSITIPPREANVIQAKTDVSSANLVYFHPDTDFLQYKSVSMIPAMVKVTDYTTVIKIYNNSDRTRTLYKNAVIGQITHTPGDVESFSIPSPISPSPRDSSTLNSIRTTTTSRSTQTLLQNCSRPYPKTVDQRRELQKVIQGMMTNNQIRPSNSPWSSPVILHKKPNGGIRFLGDYRKLNSVTKKDSFPQPTTEELVQRLGEHTYFTKLDLKSGYFQIPIDEQDKEKTAFITQDGLWEFNVLPQGVMNGPPTFQRIMHNLIGNGRWDYVVVYLDDILIFSKTFEDHKRHLNEVLSILNQASFQVNPEKCTITVREIEFLSDVINKDQIKPSPEKIRAIIELSPPKTLNEANEFIGKLNWYRKFIPHFAEIAAPIHKVTNKTKKTKHEFY